jgi:outer membrane protein insertion porin family
MQSHSRAIRFRVLHPAGVAMIVSVALLVGPVAAAGADLVVEGNRRVSADTIRSAFDPGGDPFSAAALDAALKRLYASGQFEDVKIRKADGRVVVTVVEAALVDRVAFEGNKRIKDDVLGKEVQSKPLGALLRATVQSDVQRIVEIYRRAGRYDVKVTPKVVSLPSNRVNLVFEIDEGAKITVRDVRFVGNRAFSAGRLAGIIRTAPTSLFSFFKGSDVFDADRVEADRDLLRRFYLSKGYADVRIVAAQSEFDPGRKGFVVTFTIDEGELYRIGRVDIRSSVRDIDPNDLRPLLQVDPGTVYNAEVIDKTVDAMTGEMSKRGYAFAQVRPRGDRDVAGRRIDVAFVIDEGPRVYVERINIRGNTVTQEAVIRREFDIAEGDAYNRVLLDRAERHLKALGFFKTVKISSEPGAASDRIVLDVDVEEQKTGDFSVSGGYSTQYGPIGEVSVSERNFLGRGQFVKTSVTVGQFTRGFDVSLVEPYFLGNRLSLGVNVFDRQNLVSQFQSFGDSTYGAAIQVGAPLNEQFAVQGRYSIVSQTTSLAPGVMASLPIRQAALNGPTLVSTIGGTVTYDTLDNRNNPHNGVHAELKQDVAGLGGDGRFLKTTADVRHYHEITDDVVGITRAQAGIIAPWGGRPVPLASSFFGGPQLVRGFAPNGFGPRDLTAGTTMDNVGGTRYAAVSGELQSGIPNLPPEVGMKVAVFADAGTLWGYGGPTTFTAFPGQTAQVADSRVIRSSVGAGLIWQSPFGALRVDYAVPLTKTRYDVTQPFRFSAGGF